MQEYQKFYHFHTEEDKKDYLKGIILNFEGLMAKEIGFEEILRFEYIIRNRAILSDANSPEYSGKINSNNVKDTYCLFISLSIHQVTTCYMKLLHEKEGYMFSPITIDNFKIKILSNFSEAKIKLEDLSYKKNKEFTHGDFHRIIDGVALISRKDGSDYTRWKEEINNIFEKLINKM